MGFLNKLFGMRWSLYFVQNDNQLVYAMHDNIVMKMIGYVEHRFSEGKVPVIPWSIRPNFNHTHQNFILGPEHFTQNGPSPILIQKLMSIDPKFNEISGNLSLEPIFLEAKTKKRIKIAGDSLDTTEALQARMAAMASGWKEEPTFLSILSDEIFGEK